MAENGRGKVLFLSKLGELILTKVRPLSYFYVLGFMIEKRINMFYYMISKVGTGLG